MAHVAAQAGSSTGSGTTKTRREERRAVDQFTFRIWHLDHRTESLITAHASDTLGMVQKCWCDRTNLHPSCVQLHFVAQQVAAIRSDGSTVAFELADTKLKCKEVDSVFPGDIRGDLPDFAIRLNPEVLLRYHSPDKQKTRGPLITIGVITEKQEVTNFAVYAHTPLKWVKDTYVSLPLRDCWDNTCGYFHKRMLVNDDDTCAKLKMVDHDTISIVSKEILEEAERIKRADEAMQQLLMEELAEKEREQKKKLESEARKLEKRKKKEEEKQQQDLRKLEAEQERAGQADILKQQEEDAARGEAEAIAEAKREKEKARKAAKKARRIGQSVLENKTADDEHNVAVHILADAPKLHPKNKVPNLAGSSTPAELIPQKDSPRAAVQCSSTSPGSSRPASGQVASHPDQGITQVTSLTDFLADLGIAGSPGFVSFSSAAEGDKRWAQARLGTPDWPNGAQPEAGFRAGEQRQQGSVQLSRPAPAQRRGDNHTELPTAPGQQPWLQHQASASAAAAPRPIPCSPPGFQQHRCGLAGFEHLMPGGQLQKERQAAQPSNGHTALPAATYLIPKYSEPYQAFPSRALTTDPDEEEDFDDLYCPLTLDIMEEPVICSDGITYERVAIEAWLRKHDTSPKTNLVLPHKQLVPNRALANICRRLKAKIERSH